jgi:hypothetical protein
VAVVFYVCLGRFRAMVRCVVQVSLCAMGVMSGCFVGARLMVLGRFAMMPCGVFVMLGCLVMVLGCLLGHRCSPFIYCKIKFLLCARLRALCYCPMTMK